MVALERLGFTHLHGVDLSPRLVRLYGGRGHCVVADCRSLPFRSGSQDVAIVQGGLHHLPDVRADLPLVIAEVQRVLKPGGRLRRRRAVADAVPARVHAAARARRGGCGAGSTRWPR